MDQPGSLDWEAVEAAAKLAFSVWVDHPEREWAKQAWHHVTAAGLTLYSCERERTKAAVRFVALAELYLDFCAIALDEQTGRDTWYLAEPLGITEEDVRALHGAGKRESEDDESDDDDLPGYILEELSDRVRPEVVSAILRGFDGPTELFLSLWRSHLPEPDYLFDEDGRPAADWETNDEILNEHSYQKADALEWVCQGCQPSR
jgi:hypothetical protein